MRRRAVLLGIVLVAMPVGVGANKSKDTVYIYTIKDDHFSKSLSYVGLQEMINPLGGTARRWMLRTWIEKESKAVTHQLYIVVSYYNQWRFYQAASDETANQLPFISIDRELGGCQGVCSFKETVGIEIADAFLRQKALTGFQVQLSAKSGDSLVIDVSPAQIQSQLLSDNQYLPEDRRWSAAVNLKTPAP